MLNECGYDYDRKTTEETKKVKNMSIELREEMKIAEEEKKTMIGYRVLYRVWPSSVVNEGYIEEIDDLEKYVRIRKINSQRESHHYWEEVDKIRIECYLEDDENGVAK